MTAHIHTVFDDVTPPPVCTACDGTGYFTWTVEDGTGRGVEVDSVCGSCGGSGQEQ